MKFFKYICIEKLNTRYNVDNYSNHSGFQITSVQLMHKEY